MRKILQITLIGAFLFLSVSANAELIDRGGGLIYDTDLGITLLQDVNYAYTSGHDDDGMFTTEILALLISRMFHGRTSFREKHVSELSTGDGDNNYKILNRPLARNSEGVKNYSILWN